MVLYWALWVVVILSSIGSIIGIHKGITKVDSTEFWSNLVQGIITTFAVIELLNV